MDHSALNKHAISFQSAAMTIRNLSEIVPMGNYFGLNNNSGDSTIINNNHIIRQVSNPLCSSSFLLDSVPGLKHDTGLAVEWSVHEQHKLEEGLLQYGDEPSIAGYIKIAASLPDKTVRDVALRCRWMTRNPIWVRRSIAESMKEMPGIMSQMPPLPVTIDKDLASILPSKT